MTPEHHHQPGEEYEPEPLGPAPKIWIASLADYNAGTLHGEWVDATQPVEDIQKTIHSLLDASPLPDAEEWAIFDSDEFGGFRVGEHDDLEVVTTVARGIRQHGPVFAAWAELHDGESTMMASFSDAYLGAYESRDDWAETIAEDLGIPERLEQLLPPDLQQYVRFDAASFAHDAWLSGDISVIERDDGEPGVWIFRTT